MANLSIQFYSKVSNTFSWNDLRSEQALAKIVGDGLAWVDEQDVEKSYWFPSLFPGRLMESNIL